MKGTILKGSFAVLLLASFTACKKDDNKAKKDLLTKAAWKQTAEEIGAQGQWMDAGFSSKDACEKDNQFVFRSDMSFEVNEGATKCDPSDDQVIETGTWAFAENESKITIDGNTGSIEELNDNQLRVTYTDTLFGNQINRRDTYSH